MQSQKETQSSKEKSLPHVGKRKAFPGVVGGPGPLETAILKLLKASGTGESCKSGEVCLLPGFHCLESKTVYRGPGDLPKGPQGSLLPTPG